RIQSETDELQIDVNRRRLRSPAVSHGQAGVCRAAGTWSRDARVTRRMVNRLSRSRRSVQRKHVSGIKRSSRIELSESLKMNGWVDLSEGHFFLASGSARIPRDDQILNV